MTDKVQELMALVEQYAKAFSDGQSPVYSLRVVIESRLREVVAPPASEPTEVAAKAEREFFARDFYEATHTQPASEPVAKVYLVATGEVHEGQETYTRHDVRPPLCDAETLYATPQPASAPIAWWKAVQSFADEIELPFHEAKAFLDEVFPHWMADKETAGFVTLRRDDLIEGDSYGVDGSDFYRCRICHSESGAGMLNNGIKHEADCPLYATPQPAAKQAEPVARDAAEILESLGWTFTGGRWMEDKAATATLAASPTQPRPQPLTEKDPCPGCRLGGVCRTPICGRLALPEDHPFRTGITAQEST